MSSIQVKICGLTVPEEAKACAEAGANAIGLIFYPPSPRFVNLEQASLVRQAIPDGVTTVGVFVDLPVENIILTAREVGFHTIQLHGNETSRTIWILKNAGFRVIKVLRSVGEHLLFESAEYALADAILVEASKGELPGGNGASWNWSEAQKLSTVRPFILAGGLNTSNITDALQQSGASAIDLSSGVEVSPGRKNIHSVQTILKAAHDFVPAPSTGVIFP